MNIRLMNHVRLNRQVVIDEFGGECAVRQNPSYLRRGKKHVVWFGLRKKRGDKPIVTEIQFFAGPEDQVVIPTSRESSHDRRSHHSPMSGNIDARVFFDHLGPFRCGALQFEPFGFHIRFNHHDRQSMEIHRRFPSKLPPRFRTRCSIRN